MKEKMWLLLVDDSIEYSQMIQALLQIDGAYGVDWADSLDKMRQMLDKKNYAAVLLDNNLPDGSGLEVLPDLISPGNKPPVIMITGAGDEKTASEAIKLGAYDYLSKGKPELIELSHIVDRVIRMHADVRKKNEAEEKLRYHALLLERLSDAVVVIDSAELVTFWNDGAERLFEHAAEDAIGKPLRKVLENNPGLDSYLNGTQSESGTDTFELTVPSGHTVYVSLNSASARIPEQKNYGCILVFRDITPYRLLQEELRKTQMRLLEAARVASVGELASSMAHQIHNPLTTVLGEAQILTRTLDADSAEGQSAKAIEEAGWRAAKVIKRMMKVTAEAVSEREQFDLSPTIYSAIDLSKTVLEEHQIRLDMSIEAGLPKVAVRERDLIDLWFHLLHLAAECASGAAEPWIKISVYLHDNPITVKIQCSGKLQAETDEQDGDRIPQKITSMAIGENIIQKYHGMLDIYIEPNTMDKIIVRIDGGSNTAE